MKKKSQELIWLNKNKEIISCNETNKVLNENFSEVNSVLQNSYDDAIILGCDEDDVKKKLFDLISNLNFSLGKK